MRRARIRRVRIAVFHHLPPTGGSMRVLAEYARRTRHELTIYTRTPELPDALIEADAADELIRVPLPEPSSRIGRLRLLRDLPRHGREMAARIDAGRHDAVLVLPSQLVQAPEVLPYLRTPSTYFAFEYLRVAYDRLPRLGRRSPRELLVRAGLDPYERTRRSLDRCFVRAAPHVITLSRHIARRLRDIYGVDADVVRLGVDADVFSPADVPRDGYVLSVGALHPLKGHHDVIEAVGTLPEPRPRLVICGDRGELAGELEAQAAARGVDLEIRRAIGTDALVDLYRRAGVLACAQVEEPFGLIAVEGMATATPVVAVDEGGLAESLTHERTGLLVARDARALGAAIGRVLDSPDLAVSLGRAGREEAARDWTWDATAATLDDLLERRASR
jgi:glycosyltransferase involved in cell wall biosynthesis